MGLVDWHAIAVGLKDGCKRRNMGNFGSSFIVSK